ncbi:hypothetical protein [Oceanobacillus polygoni]|uniref:Uncharacterized protein n=1 Tax=Oceanobacillus polygoni TaxID=1235259 RepID=A0A9X0YWE7_9BACI|nr:hypothetical protein [Oceanobacillus polygoni]MBP2078359.1 hypothetical protein [Oceanobacillus polygoni]
MNLIAKQTYSKVIREVSSIEQRDTEQERTMYLYDDKVVTQYREFKIHDVLDISYRFIGDDGGLLYLHTNNGVYPYIVRSSPKAFVEAFKEFQKTL